MGDIYARLEKIQKELKVPKNNRNSFGNYNYRSAEDILEAVKPLLDGAVLLVSDEIVNIGDRFYVKATAVFRNGDDFVQVHGYAREEETKKGMDGSQITGSASSYARKYALNGLFAIDDTKDADSQDNRETRGVQGNTAPQKANGGAKATDKQIEFLAKLGKMKRGMEREEFFATVAKSLKVKSVQDLEIATVTMLIEKLRNEKNVDPEEVSLEQFEAHMDQQIAKTNT